MFNYIKKKKNIKEYQEMKVALENTSLNITPKRISEELDLNLSPIHEFTTNDLMVLHELLTLVFSKKFLDSLDVDIILNPRMFYNEYETLSKKADSDKIKNECLILISKKSPKTKILGIFDKEYNQYFGIRTKDLLTKSYDTMFQYMFSKFNPKKRLFPNFFNLEYESDFEEILSVLSQKEQIDKYKTLKINVGEYLEINRNNYTEMLISNLKYAYFKRQSEEDFDKNVFYSDFSKFYESLKYTLTNLTIDYSFLYSFPFIVLEDNQFEKIYSFLSIVDSDEFKSLSLNKQQDILEQYIQKIFVIEREDTQNRSVQIVKGLLDSLI